MQACRGMLAGVGAGWNNSSRIHEVMQIWERTMWWMLIVVRAIAREFCSKLTQFTATRSGNRPNQGPLIPCDPLVLASGSSAKVSTGRIGDRFSRSRAIKRPESRQFPHFGRVAMIETLALGFHSVNSLGRFHEISTHCPDRTRPREGFKLLTSNERPFMESMICHDGLYSDAQH